MANVEIFRTNIGNQKAADLIVKRLSASFPMLKFNVDLHDSEKILRMEGELTKKRDLQRIANRWALSVNTSPTSIPIATIPIKSNLSFGRFL